MCSLLLMVALALEPTGSPCLSAADCASGVCEGFGCGEDEPGMCVEPGRDCTADMAAYCGCDGQTFGSSGTCPGARYRYTGACGEPEAWDQWMCGRFDVVEPMAAQGRLPVELVRCMETAVRYTYDAAVVGLAHRLLTLHALARLDWAEAVAAGQPPPEGMWLLPLEEERARALERVERWAEFAAENRGEHTGLAEACDRFALSCENKAPRRHRRDPKK